MPLEKLTSIFSASACLLAAMSHLAYAEPNSVGYAVYFDSDVRDADECSMSVENGEIVIDSKVTNPALNCPDMFSWKLFVDVVRDQWWSNWASDTQTWPAEPYELCKPGAQPSTCCQPGAATNPGYGDVTTKPDYPTHCTVPFSLARNQWRP